MEDVFQLVAQNEDGSFRPLANSYLSEYKEEVAKFTSTLASGLQIVKEFSTTHNFPVTRVSIRLNNPTNHPQQFSCQAMVTIHQMAGVTKTSYTSPIEGVAISADRRIKVTQPSVIKKSKHYTDALTHIALTERHFCIIAYSPQGAQGVTFQSTKDGLGLAAGIELSKEVPAQGQAELLWNIYAGPGDYQYVKSIGQEFAEPLHPGFLGQIGLVLLSLLKFIHRGVHNYGLSIILLTMFVSALLVPFNLMSLKSMQRMKAIQPLAESLRAKYKDNTEKFNKEYMALLKKHRVNPLAGCLVPLLIQMPIFLALLRVLSNSIELRGARFLWIQDLSAPDRLGKIPVSLPFFGDQLNLLPLLTIVAMFAQQKISQASMQQTNPEGMPDMSLIMLVMFGAWMYHAPAGPVIYWLTNTIIMIIWFKLANLKPVVLES